MSMRIVPADAHASIHTGPNTSAPSAPGVHDVLRAGLSGAPPSSSSSTPQPTSRHPLEQRLKAWEATQEALRHEQLRRAFGMAEPIRRGMELSITRQGVWRPACLGGAGGPSGRSVFEDVLLGKEATVDWEDVFAGEEQRPVAGVHEEMERKLKV
ncbi:proteasome maturation factor UMP1 [Xylariomycetidae sp. FL0641]|nr:proteasome maturation factor UMP1 [Xylariomycetidae sp. FL0641]